jgi:hypothetical protein
MSPSSYFERLPPTPVSVTFVIVVIVAIDAIGIIVVMLVIRFSVAVKLLQTAAADAGELCVCLFSSLLYSCLRLFTSIFLVFFFNSCIY